MSDDINKGQGCVLAPSIWLSAVGPVTSWGGAPLASA